MTVGYTENNLGLPMLLLRDQVNLNRYHELCSVYNWQVNWLLRYTSILLTPSHIYEVNLSECNEFATFFRSQVDNNSGNSLESCSNLSRTASYYQITATRIYIHIHKI